MENFRVHSLDAKYVGPFEHLHIEFKEKPEQHKDEAEVHIFTGENGTGKSTVLYLLTCYPNTQLVSSRIPHDNPENFYVEIKYPYFGDRSQYHSIIYQPSIGGRTIEGINNGPFYSYFKWFTNPDIVFNYRFPFAMFAYSGQRKIDNPKLQAIQEIKSNPLTDSLDFAKSTNSQTLLQWIANTQTRGALAFKEGKEKKALNYELSLQKLQIAISEIVGEEIEFKLKDRPFDVFVKWNKQVLTFEVLPDGLKSIISWLGDLIMRLDRIEWETEADIFDRNFILFLDEIDIHLHPAWQRKILPVVKKLFKNAQIFISTHSPFVVGSVDGAWVYKFKKEGQYNVLDGQPVLSEDAKSYRLILDEVFGIKEQFGENVEKKLREFYTLRKEILEDKRSISDQAFQQLVDELISQKSIELESIIGLELRQLERIKKTKQLQPA